MKVKDMFTKEFYDKYGSIDVYDDICEELAIGFEGPMLLTDKGKDVFKEVLEDDINVNIDDELYEVMVIIDDLPEGVWQRHLKGLCKLFNGAAGYCTEKEWDEWFIREV